MSAKVKSEVLSQLTARFGKPTKLPRSQSLYEYRGGKLRIYVRYSRVHGSRQTFFGLRQEDLRQLEGFLSYVCFIWDGQVEPLFLPFAEYEEVFRTVDPASDGQYKVQVYIEDQATQLYLARAGRFNIDSYFGWQGIETHVDDDGTEPTPNLTHSQVQTLLGTIGNSKSFDVWIPLSDRRLLDSHLGSITCCARLPGEFDAVRSVLEEVDVIWVERGSGRLRALFEVEHSTPIYSGLLRFNDVHLVRPSLAPTFTIVANDERRSLFVRQLGRPTFQASGLNELCTFMQYDNVFGWFKRLTSCR